MSFSNSSLNFVFLTFILILSFYSRLSNCNLFIFEDEEGFIERNLDPPNPTRPPPPSNSPVEIYGSAGVSSDAPGCSEIGGDILERGGKVVDAAIATLLCMGVVHPQSSGVGGGFIMVLYEAETNSSIGLIAREMAPLAATENMFEGNSSLSQRGPLAVATPGEIKGYWEMYKKYGGGRAWKELFEPTIKMCREGIKVSASLASSLRSHQTAIRRESTMREIFINPETNETWIEGDFFTRNVLADTFETIANSEIGGDEIYIGKLGEMLAKDLEDMGGIMTFEDLKQYNVDWVPTLKIPIHQDLTLHAIPPPASGILSAFVFKILSGFQPDKDTFEDEEKTNLFFHRIAEAFKFAFAKRTYLGDPINANDDEIKEIIEQLVEDLQSEEYVDEIRNLIMDDLTNNTYEYYGAELYQPEDHGTAHVSIIGQNGDAISVTSTVNLGLGAQIRSVSTGIIYNDEMDDFSAPDIENAFGVPPSPNNFIMPRKRPLSSMTPSIFTDFSGNVLLSIGAAGGTRITTSVIYIAMRHLWFGNDIKESLDARRIHHQLFPMEFNYEFGFLDQNVKSMEEKEHVCTRVSSIAAANAVSRDPKSGQVSAALDFRKSGSISGFPVLEDPGESTENPSESTEDPSESTEDTKKGSASKNFNFNKFFIIFSFSIYFFNSK